MTASTPQLAPCPYTWCRGDISVERIAVGVYQAFCSACGARGPCRDSRPAATASWNLVAKLPEELRRLRANSTKKT